VLSKLTYDRVTYKAGKQWMHDDDNDDEDDDNDDDDDDCL
jgi:hypothetical protein